jgi:hypothetical protein
MGLKLLENDWIRGLTGVKFLLHDDRVPHWEKTMVPVPSVPGLSTLEGHPLAGWRYWRVHSVGTNDVVIETGAYDQPGYEPLQYAGYYVAEGTIHKAWQEYMQFIQKALQAPQGSNLGNSLGGIRLRTYPWGDGTLLQGYMDYYGDFTQYILNNVCQADSCN